MPCASPSVPTESGETVLDLLEVHPFVAAHKYVPANKAELVRAVITAGPSSLRALGSLYSLSQVTDARDVVSTERLDLHLSAPLGGTSSLSPARMRTGADFLATLANADARLAGRHLIHVEAGIKVKDLLRDLHVCGLDLPTSGAGGGQSLAGALSTGTHGADFRVPVLGDWVRALHIVSSGGREVWITGANSPFGGPGVATRPDMCADAEIIADDTVLNAARVAVGRFGVIYSMVLEVVPAYGLLEVYLQQSWPALRSSLAASAPGTGGEFDRPLVDLESGWFRSEVRERVIVKYALTQPSPDNAYDMEYIGGPRTAVHAPITAGLEPMLFGAMLTRLGLAPLAVALRGSGMKALHHMNTAISLADPNRCCVTRRWQVPPTLPAIQQTGVKHASPTDRITEVVEDKANHRRPTVAVKPLRDLILDGTDQGILGGKWAALLIKGHGIDAQADRIFEFCDEDLPRICQQHEDAGATIFEALFMVLYKVATDAILRPDSTMAIVRAVSDLIGGDTISKFVRCGTASEILDTHNYALDGAQSGNSAEYFFDASDGAHLRFIDAVIALASTYAPVFGYIGLRFVPKSSALLGMPRFALTAAIEISTARSRVEDVYAAFWTDLHALANRSEGIAHWGQESRQTKEYVADRFGTNLKAWQIAVGRVAGAAPTFSTEFTRLHGLEPDSAAIEDDDDAVDRYLAGLLSAES